MGPDQNPRSKHPEVCGCLESDLDPVTYIAKHLSLQWATPKSEI